MDAFIVVATKGRAKETFILLDYLAKQTYPIKKIVIVGNENSDVIGLDTHKLVISSVAIIKLSGAGSCKQRNVGLNLLSELTSALNPKDWFVTFFDDDFRPADDWLENCSKNFITNPNVVGLTGYLLADGVHSSGLNELEAKEILRNPTLNASRPASQEVGGLYGCNMSIRGNFASIERFDENLPLYGWQEDIDYSSRASRIGVLLYSAECVGVHMGVSSGRTSGVKFGYSQIANPIYLYKKGTMSFKKMMTLMSRNIASNVVRTIILNRKKDYKGRLIGNFMAFLDFLLGKCDPMNVINFNK